MSANRPDHSSRDGQSPSGEPEGAYEDLTAKLNQLAEEQREAWIDAAIDPQSGQSGEFEKHSREHLRALMDTEAAGPHNELGEDGPASAGQLSSAPSLMAVRRVLPLVAAAGLLALIWNGWGDEQSTKQPGGDPDPNDIELGGPNELDGSLSPNGQYRIGEPFRWQLQAPLGGSILLEIEDFTTQEVLLSEELDADSDSWSPPNEFPWPEEILWRIVPLSSGGDWGAAVEAQAQPVRVFQGDLAIRDWKPDQSAEAEPQDSKAETPQDLLKGFEDQLRELRERDPAQSDSEDELRQLRQIGKQLEARFVEWNGLPVLQTSFELWGECAALIALREQGEFAQAFEGIRAAYSDEHAVQIGMAAATYLREEWSHELAGQMLSDLLSLQLDVLSNHSAALHLMSAQLATNHRRFGLAQDHLERAQALGSLPPVRRIELADEQVDLAVAMGRIEEATVRLAELSEIVASCEDSELATQGLWRTWIAECEIHLASLRFSAAEKKAVQALEELRQVSGAAESWFGSQLQVQLAAARWELARSDDPKWIESAEESLRAVTEAAFADQSAKSLAHSHLMYLYIQTGRKAQALRQLELLESFPSSPRARLNQSEALGRMLLADWELLVASSESGTLDSEELESFRSQLRLARQGCESVFQELLTDWDNAPLDSSGVGLLNGAHNRRLLSTLTSLTLLEGRLAEQEPGRSVSECLGYLHEVGLRGRIVRSAKLRSTWLSDPEQSLEVLCSGNAGVLLFLPGRDRGHVFALDAKQRRQAPLGAVVDIASLRKDLQRAEARSVQDPDGLAKASAVLGQALIPEALAQQVYDWDSATLIGAEWFDEIPFEILRPFHGDSVGQRLGDALALAYLPSLPMATWLAGGEVSAADRDLLLLAAPADGLAELEEIPFGAAEEQALAGGAAQSKMRVLTGELANKEALALALGENRFAAAHVVCHGARVLDDPRGIALALAPVADREDGLLRYDDISGLAWPALVVVSACDAGESIRRRGEDGSATLGGAFLEGGAREVLLSSGKIRYSDVLVWTPELAGHLHNGHSIAEALRRMRIARSDRDVLSLWRVIGLGLR